MAITDLKKASRTAESSDDETQPIIRDMLAAIEIGGEDAARAYAAKLDGWEGDIVVPADAFRDAESRLPETVKEDIRYARARVGDFAKHQRDSQQEFKAPLADGLVAGQRLIPVATAGCYVPGGLNLGKFIKVLTYQRMTREAAPKVAQVSSRISRLEGMEGHAMTGDLRLAKYFPDEEFDLQPGSMD